MNRGPKTQPYQLCTRTARSAADVLADLASSGPGGVATLERAQSYVVLGTTRRRRYTAGQAVALTTLIALGVLIASGFVVPLVALLPVAALPFVPLLLYEGDPVVAVSAVEDHEGVIVTAHGRATPQVIAALDLFLAGLPPPPVVREITGGAQPNGSGGSGKPSSNVAGPTGQIRSGGGWTPDRS